MENKREPIDHAFNMKRLNVWFGLSAVLMFLIFVAAVFADYTREWKRIQSRFNDLEIEKTRAAIEAADQAIPAATRAQLEEKLAAAQGRIDAEEKEIASLDARLAELDAKIYKVDQEVRFAKALLDADKYAYETAGEHNDPKAGELGRKVAAGRGALAKATLALDALQVEQAEATARRDALTSDLAAARKERSTLFAERDRLSRKLQGIEHNFVNDWFRNRPLVDFIAPSQKVNQIVIEGLKNDINYLTIPRVDRCTTCHLAIDKKGYENEEQPFRTHPKLDLYLSAESPHPIDDYGCTICHNGRDRGTSFVNAAHTPSDEEEAKRWEEEYGWEKLHHWQEPMFPSELIEASCTQCHHGVVDVRGADKLSEGMHLIRNNGCTGCHKISGLEEVPKAGPSLAALEGKITPEWTFRWLKNPKAFRPTTRMPRFFDLENTSEPYDLERNNVEAEAIVSYLFDVSKRSALDPIPAGVSGDPARGRELVASVGCRGCHLMEGEEPDPAQRYRRFGPPLTGLGSKTSAEWVWNWVKHPKRIMPTTRMPDLRLTDQEAADITAYLVGQRHAEFGSAAMPAISDTLRDAVVLEYLKGTLSDGDARGRLAAMSPAEKRHFLGEKLISRYGCFGCHEIAGFEQSKGIGTELSEEGSKPVHRFDFGFVEIPSTRADWIRHKLLHPRSFDHGRVKEPQEKLRMPQFDFTEHEAGAITLAVLSLRKRNVSEGGWREPRGAEVAANVGWRVIHNQNCRGCHMIDGEGGDFRALVEDPGLAPPMLMGEGDRVQADWLFAFLKRPSPIRPWLSVRMPTFHFDDATANSLVQHFEATAPKGGGYQEVPAESLLVASVTRGRKIFEDYRCIQCHQLGGASGRDPADLAPDLALAPGRLRPGWIVDWLRDPQVLMPETRMPSYFYSGGERLLDDADAQIVDLRNYILTLGKGP